MNACSAKCNAWLHEAVRFQFSKLNITFRFDHFLVEVDQQNDNN
jgi:hypothetical protein